MTGMLWSMLLWYCGIRTYCDDFSIAVLFHNSSVIILAFVKSEGKKKQVRNNESAESEHSGSEDEHTSLVSVFKFCTSRRPV